MTMTFLGLEARKDLPKVCLFDKHDCDDADDGDVGYDHNPKIMTLLIIIIVITQVHYPTALDYFVFISFTYIFSTVVQVLFH